MRTTRRKTGPLTAAGLLTVSFRWPADADEAMVRVATSAHAAGLHLSRLRGDGRDVLNVPFGTHATVAVEWTCELRRRGGGLLYAEDVEAFLDAMPEVENPTFSVKMEAAPAPAYIESLTALFSP